MGSIFGAAFVEADIETILVDVSHPLVEHLNAHGLVIVANGQERRFDVRATASPASIGPVDVILLFVKTYQTESAGEVARSLAGPETIVCTLQNGRGNGEILMHVFPSAALVVGVTYNSGTVLETGKVVHGQAAKGQCIIGPQNGTDLSRSEKVAALLDAGGFPATVTTDVDREIWRKLIVSAAANATSALTGYSSRALYEDNSMLEIVDQLVRETVAVARACGHDLDVEEHLRRTRAALVAAEDGRASMLQDLEAGRRTEIDAINGAVVQEAERRGVDVPLNRALVALVSGYERAHALR